MLRLLLILHLVIRFRQGLTQRVNMCVENFTSINNESFVLYANGGSQCITRTCSCSVSIRDKCAPARFSLTVDRPSNGCNCRYGYNDTLTYRRNTSDNAYTLLWNGTHMMKTGAIQGVSEPFRVTATYSGGCSLNYQLTILTNGQCRSWRTNFNVTCQVTTEMTTTTERANASFTSKDTVTQRTTSAASSADFQAQEGSKSNKNGETGMIVGIAVGVGGGLILLIVVIIIVVIVMRRRRASADQSENASSAKRTASIPNPYELPSANAAAAAASNGRVNYQPLNAPPQYQSEEASNDPTQSQNIGNVGDHNQQNNYDNFFGRNNEALSSSSSSDYYNASAVVNDNGMAAETSPAGNDEVTVIENSLYT